MNNRGYLLSELIISFSLTFVILIVIFNSTISLNRKLSDLFVENKAASQQIIFNRKVGNDFIAKTVYSMTPSDGICTISYSDGTEGVLKYNKSELWIEYNEERINLPDNMKLGDTITCTIENNLAKLKVPIKYSKQDKDYGIELYNLSSSFTY